MKKLLLTFTAFTLLGCTTSPSTSVAPLTSQQYTTQTQPTSLPAPIQMEVKAEEPLIKSGPNLYGLGPWLNSEPIGALEDLRGQVVLLKFWTFGCSNCIHTLPHVQAWHEKYEDQGLKILGIHSPEFAYEHKLENVQKSIDKYGLTFPVALDNDFKTWRSFNNRYWPAFYLIDTKGNIVYKHFGQGDYEDTQERIEALLQTVKPQTSEIKTLAETQIAPPKIPHSLEEIAAMTEAEKIAAEAELLTAFAGTPDIVFEEAMPDLITKNFTPQTVKTGTFKDADRSHKGSGQVQIITQEEGSHLLRLEDFSVTNGPDLFVSLVENPNPKKGKDVEAGFINIAPLKANQGSQNYTIPANIDLNQYSSVVIYCRAYSVVFSVAPLQ